MVASISNILFKINKELFQHFKLTIGYQLEYFYLKFPSFI